MWAVRMGCRGWVPDRVCLAARPRLYVRHMWAPHVVGPDSASGGRAAQQSTSHTLPAPLCISHALHVLSGHSEQRPTRVAGKAGCDPTLQQHPGACRTAWLGVTGRAAAQVLPAWLGIGHALQALFRQGKLGELQQMYEEWPFFASGLDLCEMVRLCACLRGVGCWAACVRACVRAWGKGGGGAGGQQVPGCACCAPAWHRHVHKGGQPLGLHLCKMARLRGRLLACCTPACVAVAMSAAWYRFAEPRLWPAPCQLQRAYAQQTLAALCAGRHWPSSAKCWPCHPWACLLLLTAPARPAGAGQGGHAHRRALRPGRRPAGPVLCCVLEQCHARQAVRVSGGGLLPAAAPGMQTQAAVKSHCDSARHIRLSGTSAFYRLRVNGDAAEPPGPWTVNPHVCTQALVDSREEQALGRTLRQKFAETVDAVQQVQPSKGGSSAAEIAGP